LKNKLPGFYGSPFAHHRTNLNALAANNITQQRTGPFRRCCRDDFGGLRASLVMADKTFSVNAPKIWNDLTFNCRAATCVLRFLANAICYRPSVCLLSSVCLSVCLSVVCIVRAPYSGSSNFQQYFYGIRYLGHPLTSTENFTEIVSGERLRRGELNSRGIAQYSDFGPIDGYISETRAR